jgi:hypothetical protein
MTFLEFLEPFQVSLFKKKMVLVYDQHRNARNKPKQKRENHFDEDGVLIAPALIQHLQSLLLSNSNSRMQSFEILKAEVKYNMVPTLQVD